MDLFEDAAELGTALDLLETDSDDEPLAKKAKQKPAVRKNIRRRAAPPPAKPAVRLPLQQLGEFRDAYPGLVIASLNLLENSRYTKPSSACSAALNADILRYREQREMIDIPLPLRSLLNTAQELSETRSCTYRGSATVLNLTCDSYLITCATTMRSSSSSWRTLSAPFC